MVANAFLNAKEFANVFLMLVTNQLVMGRLVDGRFRDKPSTENGAKIYVKRPPRFVVKTGAALQNQDIVVGQVELNVNQYKNVHFAIEDLEGIQSWNQLVKNETVSSAASALAHEIDRFLCGKFLEFNAEVGTPGNIIGTPQEFNKAHTRLMQQSAPNSNLSAAVDFADGEEIRGALIGGDIGGINRSALERTRIPILSEVDVFATQNLVSVTNGTRTNAAINGAAQNVFYNAVKDDYKQDLNIKTAGAAGATIKKGEVFTIAGVFAVNPRNQEVYPHLQQFTVLADTVTAGAGQDATVSITPPIIVPGSGAGSDQDVNTAFATVNAAPADSAVVTWSGAASATRTVRAAFHKQAIAMVSSRLMVPATGEAAFQVDPTTGIGIRAWRYADASTGRHGWRLDTVYGASVTDPLLGVRVNGT